MKSVDKTLPYRAAGRHLLSTEGLWRASVDTALPYSALQRPCLSTGITLLKHLSRIIGSGYGFGLQGGRHIGSLELNYWATAFLMKRILESKISKVGSADTAGFPCRKSAVSISATSPTA